jgi:hypothetical protein
MPSWRAAKHPIACTGSFGQPITELHELLEAITQFVCCASEKLCRQNSHTGQLMDLQPATLQQLTLDLDADMPENRIRLMQAMDQLNQRYGRGTLKLASGGAPRDIKLWAMKQEHKTTAYTTDWAGLANARS